MVEIASIIVLGIFAQWVAWRFKVPAILPLILIGLAVGPFSSLFLEGGHKWLEPIYNGERGLFPGEKLFQFVELAIGIILFEGGLTLKRNEIKEVGSSILNLITIGSLITFVGATLLVHFILGLSWAIAALFAALIIVTGPTVIAPILRNLPLKKNVASVLKWEGILIDPIGALAAVCLDRYCLRFYRSLLAKTIITERVDSSLLAKCFHFSLCNGSVCIFYDYCIRLRTTYSSNHGFSNGQYGCTTY